MQRIRRINPKHQFILRIRFALQYHSISLNNESETLHALSLISAMEKSHDLRTCAAIVLLEQAFSNAVGDIVLQSPCHSVCIVAVGGTSEELFCAFGSGKPAARHRKMTIWARVRGWFGPKKPLPMPLVIPFAATHLTVS